MKRDSRGNVIRCDHPGCYRLAVKVVGVSDTPNTLGQTHDCCSRHCRG